MPGIPHPDPDVPCLRPPQEALQPWLRTQPCL